MEGTAKAFYCEITYSSFLHLFAFVDVILTDLYIVF